jgi:hypothetical protein
MGRDTSCYRDPITLSRSHRPGQHDVTTFLVRSSCSAYCGCQPVEDQPARVSDAYIKGCCSWLLVEDLHLRPVVQAYGG